MNTLSESIIQLKSLSENLNCDKETLCRIQDFLSELEIELDKPCPNSPDLNTDESGIAYFLESFKNFLSENSLPEQLPMAQFLAEVETPPCSCNKEPCPPQSRIINFMDSFDETNSSSEPEQLA